MGIVVVATGQSLPSEGRIVAVRDDRSVFTDIFRDVPVPVVGGKREGICFFRRQQSSDAAHALHRAVKVKTPCVAGYILRPCVLGYYVVVVPDVTRSVLHHVPPDMVIGVGDDILGVGGADEAVLAVPEVGEAAVAGRVAVGVVCQ